MSQIRKAHSVEIIDRRLKQYESLNAIDAMELIGLYDELARVERKWLEKAARLNSGDSKPGNRGERPLSDADQLNARFERLMRFVDAALRGLTTPSPERDYLATIAEALHGRKPVAQIS